MTLPTPGGPVLIFACCCRFCSTLSVTTEAGYILIGLNFNLAPSADEEESFNPIVADM